ncbi:hypothetical protein [Chitinivorax sp. B]|uniref:hypothetical protein n=1 Tax=Chitinivorax sp. B TaxID=2502235 RepID=UPI0010F92B56|nr:hypothetical protein [Chitinivorax sp. B]
MHADPGKLKNSIGQMTVDSNQLLSNTLQTIKNELVNTRENLKARRQQIEDSTYQYVVSHPARSLGIVAVSGIAIGFLLGLWSHHTGE